MRTKDLQRAFKYSELHYESDVLAGYYYNVCIVLGTFVEIGNEPKGFMFGYKHLCVHNELCDLRDIVAKELLKKIKGVRI